MRPEGQRNAAETRPKPCRYTSRRRWTTTGARTVPEPLAVVTERGNDGRARPWRSALTRRPARCPARRRPGRGTSPGSGSRRSSTSSTSPPANSSRRRRRSSSSCPADTYSDELQRSVVESNSPVCEDLASLRAALVASRRLLVETAAGQGLGIVAAGTVPLVDPLSLAVTPSVRYERMLADYQLLVREQLICGAQVHVQVSDRDLAVADRPAGHAVPARPARALGQLAVLDGRGHRLRQHPLPAVAALADRGPLRRDRHRRRARRPGRRPRRVRHDQRPRDDLLRRPAVGARADARAAGLRRLPRRRRRRPARRPLPRAGAPRAGRRPRRRPDPAAARRRCCAAPCGAPPGPGSRACCSTCRARRGRCRAAERGDAAARRPAPAARGGRRLGDRARPSPSAALARGSSAARSSARSTSAAGGCADVVDLLLAHATRGDAALPGAAPAAGRTLPLLRAARATRCSRPAARSRRTPRSSASSSGSARRPCARRERVRERGAALARASRSASAGARASGCSRSTSCRGSCPPRTGRSCAAASCSGPARSTRSSTTSTASGRSSRTASCPASVVDAAPGLRSVGAIFRRQAVRAHVCGMDLVRDGAGGLVRPRGQRAGALGARVRGAEPAAHRTPCCPTLPRPDGLLDVEGAPGDAARRCRPRRCPPRRDSPVGGAAQRGTRGARPGSSTGCSARRWACPSP